MGFSMSSFFDAMCVHLLLLTIDGIWTFVVMLLFECLCHKTIFNLGNLKLNCLTHQSITLVIYKWIGCYSEKSSYTSIYNLGHLRRNWVLWWIVASNNHLAHWSIKQTYIVLKTFRNYHHYVCGHPTHHSYLYHHFGFFELVH